MSQSKTQEHMALIFGSIQNHLHRIMSSFVAWTITQRQLKKQNVQPQDKCSQRGKKKTGEVKRASVDIPLHRSNSSAASLLPLLLYSWVRLLLSFVQIHFLEFHTPPWWWEHQNPAKQSRCSGHGLSRQPHSGTEAAALFRAGRDGNTGLIQNTSLGISFWALSLAGL